MLSLRVGMEQRAQSCSIETFEWTADKNKIMNHYLFLEFWLNFSFKSMLNVYGRSIFQENDNNLIL